MLPASGAFTCTSSSCLWSIRNLLPSSGKLRLDLIPLGDELIPAGFQSGYLVRSGSKLHARWKNDVISLGDDVDRFNFTRFSSSRSISSAARKGSAMGSGSASSFPSAPMRRPTCGLSRSTTRRYRCHVAWPSTGTTIARPTSSVAKPRRADRRRSIPRAPWLLWLLAAQHPTILCRSPARRGRPRGGCQQRLLQDRGTSRPARRPE